MLLIGLLTNNKDCAIGTNKIAKMVLIVAHLTTMIYLSGMTEFTKTEILTMGW